jgi:hypothetical protein
MLEERTLGVIDTSSDPGLSTQDFDENYQQPPSLPRSLLPKYLESRLAVGGAILGRIELKRLASATPCMANPGVHQPQAARLNNLRSAPPSRRQKYSAPSTRQGRTCCCSAVMMCRWDDFEGHRDRCDSSHFSLTSYPVSIFQLVMLHESTMLLFWSQSLPGSID